MIGLKNWTEENEQVEERFELCLERLRQIPGEETVRESYCDFFTKGARFLLLLGQIISEAKTGLLQEKTIQELEEWNHILYEDILPGAYETSYANPEYAAECFGKRLGRAVTCLMSELRSLIPAAFEAKVFELTVGFELFLEIYQYFETAEGTEEELYRAVVRALYYYVHDYMEEFTLHTLREQFDPTCSFARDILLETDCSDPRILYYYGEYISENERKTAQFLNSLPEEQVRAMADTYVDGYIRGFHTMGADFSKKSIVSLRYPIGFERMLQFAAQRFEKMGKQITANRVFTSLAVRSRGRRGGYHGVSPNPQYDYDHRFDDGLYYDKKLKETAVSARRNASEKLYREMAQFAGPAVVEAFGEPEYHPYLKPASIQRDLKQQKLMTELNRDISILQMDYIKPEETSFTIIAYPLPSIGEEYEQIFRETVQVNTLDNETYQKIGQVLVDTLDRGVAVSVIGAKENRTNLTICLHPLTDPKTQTNFENCTADVNIPVGEVFTSPVLKGTSGTLHVSEVYLNGLYYRGLCLTFEDGKIVSYDCENFETEEENHAFLKENLLFQQESLPMGEFAIGTNTTAYVMAQKYQIQGKLPILIAEKTGPHFAVGDTCYKMSEDHKVYNPDGKEIIARENECSALRHTDIEKAYFNCHTDITIPYHEIKEIASVAADGTKTVIIQDGRFVLPGTEALNEPFYKN